MKVFVLFIYISALLSGCATAIYSPSLSLPVNHLRKHEFDVSSSIELLPQTNINSNSPIVGVNMSGTMGISDEVSIHGKYWSDFGQKINGVRYGGYIGMNLLLKKHSKFSYILTPRFGLSFDGKNIAGYGLGSHIVCSYLFSNKFASYSGLGVAYGLHSFNRINNIYGESKVPHGFALIIPIGFGYNLTNNIRLNLENNFIYQIDLFNNNTYLIPSPCLTLGYTLKKN